MRGQDSGYAHGTTGSPQATFEQAEYAIKVAENEAKLAKEALNATPSFKSVSIDVKGKLEGYVLNPEHPTGKHKAKVFKSALGFTQEDAAELAEQIRDKVQNCEAIRGKLTKYGQHWTVRIPIEGKNGRTALVETGWLVDNQDFALRLLTAYVVKEKKHV